MDGKFRRPNEERVLMRVEQWNEMKRKPAEGFKSFWIRMERIHAHLMDLGIIWPQKVAFQKAFSALSMTREQQTLTRAALEMSEDHDSLLELKRVTVKLFDNQSQAMEEICNNEMINDEGDGSEEVQWEVHGDKSKSSKSRGGTMQRSITSTQNLYGMKTGQKGGGKSPGEGMSCRNCGQMGHWWRGCRNLLKKPVIFNRAQGYSKKGGKKSGNTALDGKNANRTNVIIEEETSTMEGPSNDIKSVDYEHSGSIGDEYMLGDEEYLDQIDEFFGDGNEWEGTFVVYDVMENSVLVHSDNKSVDKVRFGMIDSGASATVCGISWYKQWIDSNDEVKLRRSDKQFRFGDGRVVRSLGSITLAVQTRATDGKNVVFQLHSDVVPGMVPLLISYGSLHKARCILDFFSNELRIGNQSIILKATPRGHLYLPMTPSQEKEIRSIWNTQENENDEEVPPIDSNEINPTKLHRLHVHLGHASEHTMMRILMQSKAAVDMQKLKQTVGNYGCDQLKYGFQRPLVHSNKPLKCGTHVALDIFYPVSGSSTVWPYLIMICMLSRFAMTAPLDSHKATSVIEVFFCCWCQGMGKPNRLVTDRGRSFSGPEWDQFLSAFAIEHVMHSARSHHENGLVERSVALIKIAFGSMQSACPLVSVNRLVAWACMIKT